MPIACGDSAICTHYVYLEKKQKLDTCLFVPSIAWCRFSTTVKSVFTSVHACHSRWHCAYSLWVYQVLFAFVCSQNGMQETVRATHFYCVYLCYCKWFLCFWFHINAQFYYITVYLCLPFRSFQNISYLVKITCHPYRDFWNNLKHN